MTPTQYARIIKRHGKISSEKACAIRDSEKRHLLRLISWAAVAVVSAAFLAAKYL